MVRKVDNFSEEKFTDVQGGAVTRLLIPPTAIQAIRAPETFAKIEAFAAYKLQGAAKLLYAALADKKRMAQNHWTFDLDELRSMLSVADKKAYDRWNNLRARILEPALKAINDFGTVTVTMTPERVGRSIATVRFDWHWKTIDEARETEEENERHDIARRKHQEDASAPPLVQRSPKVEEILRKNGVLDSKDQVEEIQPKVDRIPGDTVAPVSERRAALRAKQTS